MMHRQPAERQHQNGSLPHPTAPPARPDLALCIGRAGALFCGLIALVGEGLSTPAADVACTASGAAVGRCRRYPVAARSALAATTEIPRVELRVDHILQHPQQHADEEGSRQQSAVAEPIALLHDAVGGRGGRLCG